MKNLICFLFGALFTVITMDLTNCYLSRLEDNYENKTCLEILKSAKDTGSCFERYRNENPKYWAVSMWLIQPGIGLYEPLTARCVKEGSPLPGGFKSRGRGYFQCNKLQIFISDAIYGPNHERNQ